MNERLRIDLVEVLSVPVLVFLGYAVAPLGSRLWLGILVSVGALVLSVPLLVRRSRAVRASQTPIIEAMRAIAVFAAILIAGFASLHYAIAVNTDHQYSGIETKIDAVYYTVTMLSTVGFGDVTADGQLARLMVTLNILFNLVALGVGLRLVTHAAQQRFQEQGTRLVGGPPDEA